FYFVIKRNDLFIVGAGLIAVPLKFLGPRDHQSEIGCLRKLRQFCRFRRRQNSRLQAHGFEMLSSMPTGHGVYRSHKLGVLAKLHEHGCVFASHRTVHDSGTSSLGNGSRCSNSDSTVNYRQLRMKQLNITSSLTDKILNLKWVAYM